MAIALDVGSVTTRQLGTSPIAVQNVTISAGTNIVLLCGVTFTDATATVSSVVWDAATANEALTPISNTQIRGNSVEYIEWYIKVNPTVKTADLTVTLSANVNAQIGAAAFTGVNTGAPTSGGATNAYVFVDPSTDVTSAAGDLVIDLVYYATGGNPVVDGSQTILWNPAPTFYGWGSSYEAGAASVSMDWTASGNVASQSAFNLKQATSSAPYIPDVTQSQPTAHYRTDIIMARQTIVPVPYLLTTPTRTTSAVDWLQQTVDINWTVQ